MNLDVYCDGGSRANPGNAACAFVVYERFGNTAGNLRKIVGKGTFLGVATNNVAEYKAVVEALDWLLGFARTNSGIEKITFNLDSNLVASQINGLFRVKENRLITLFGQVRLMLEALAKLLPGTKVCFQYIPRAQNSEADGLVNLTLDRNT